MHHETTLGEFVVGVVVIFYSVRSSLFIISYLRYNLTNNMLSAVTAACDCLYQNFYPDRNSMQNGNMANCMK